LEDSVVAIKSICPLHITRTKVWEVYFLGHTTGSGLIHVHPNY